MGLAAAIMAGSIFLSRFMGLIRDKVISYFHGASLESDIYFASFVVPDFLNYLLAGGYFSITLIPLLAARFEHDEQDGWRLPRCLRGWRGWPPRGLRRWPHRVLMRSLHGGWHIFCALYCPLRFFFWQAAVLPPCSTCGGSLLFLRLPRWCIMPV
jgi:hypothetical protein